MTKRITSQEQHLVILRRLLVEGHLLTTELEVPKPKQLQVKEQRGPKPSRTKYVPHASLFERLDELRKMHAIKSSKHKITNKGDPINKHQITFFGFIELFRLTHGNFNTDLLKHIKDFLPLIGIFIDEVPKELFSNKQLFDTFTTVCVNTKIFPEYNALTRGILPSYSIRRKSKWAHRYDVEILIPQISSTYTLRENQYIYGDKKNQKNIDLETNKITTMINKMIIFAFYHELMMRCHRLGAEALGYPTPDEIKFVMKSFRGNKIIVNIYLNYLQKIYSIQNKESKVLKKIETSLRRSGPSFKKSI